MVLSLLAYGVIPLYTLAFVRGTGWFSSNFSVIASLEGQNIAFALWGVLIGCTLYRMLFPVIGVLPGRRPKRLLYALLNLALLLLTAAVILPYLPDLHPGQALLHTACAFLAAVALFLCLLGVVARLSASDPAAYRPFWTGLGAVLIGCALLFAASGIINTALELLATISACVLTRRLYRRVLGR